MRKTHRAARIITPVMSLCLLAACGSSDVVAEEPEYPQLAPYWRDFFDTELEYAEQRGDQFALDVLADYWVTDDEWNSAEDLFYECMQSKGLNGWIYLVGEYVSSGPTRSDEAKAIQGLSGIPAEEARGRVSNDAFACTDDTVLTIGLAYAGPRANPDGVTMEETLSRCLSQVGRDDLAQLPMDDVLLMNYYNPFEGDAAECIADPSYTN